MRQSMNDEDRRYKVDRLKTLETVRTNKAKHVGAYRDACEGYKLEVAEKTAAFAAEYAAALAEAVAKVQAADKPVNFYVDSKFVSPGLKVPVSYAEKYDWAETVLSTQVDDVIEITNAEMRCWVQDKWDWTANFHMSNVGYAIKYRETAVGSSPR